MRLSRVVLAVILALVGLLWIGQGSGLIAGSAMSNVALFAVIGALLVLGAVAIVVRERQLAARH